MCLVALAWNCHPRWRLLLAGNRDEFHARPTAALAAWQLPGRRVLAGRDLRSGGTWAGLADDGRVAVVTNVRDPMASASGPSRGQLVADYLAGGADAAGWASTLEATAAQYPPFNLVLADAHQCRFLSNHPADAQVLAAGVHGVSNGPLRPAWPKTARLMAALQAWVDGGGEDPAPLWAALADPTAAADTDLPDTGVGLALERRLSSAFIRGPDYGTRASTLIAVGHDGRGWIAERRFGANGLSLSETRLEI
ncbi:MAG: NRDE family protein [Pseudoxanthomonas sp.]